MMNWIKWNILIGLILVTFIACSKDIDPKPTDDSPNIENPNPNEDPVNTDPVHIHRALFTDPAFVGTKLNDPQILEYIINFLGYAPKGAKVHLSIYLFSYNQLIEAIEEAYNRGVEIHLLIDNGRGESKDENKNTIAKLQGLLKSPSRVVLVNNDATSNAINHEKYVLFSDVHLSRGIAKNVVLNSSHNFTLAGTTKVQDAVVMTNKELYDAFLDNWENIASRSRNGMKNFQYKIVSVGDSIEAHFFPRRENGSWDNRDTYLEIFDKIDDWEDANVRVIMSDWTRVEVAEKLNELAEKGVYVEVITKNKSGNADAVNEVYKLRAKGGYVKIVDMNKANTHSKIVLIKGKWDGKEQEIVLCGSHNFTHNALRNNNEVLLLLKNSSLFKDYYEYFDELKKTL